MSNPDNVRKLAGASLKVDDLASSFVTQSGLITISFTGGSPIMSDTTDSASTIADEKDVQLVDPGTATVEIFGDLDNLFYQELIDMAEAQEIRTFVFTLATGTKTECTFDAFVTNIPISASLGDKYKHTITLECTSFLVWDEPA